MASLSASKRTHAQFDAATSQVSHRLGWLRAGVLGANDGIVSTAGLVIGVAGAAPERGALLLAGIAGLAAGALSMGVGEYVSVSTQRDTEAALLALERQELAELPEQELRELAGLLQKKGMSKEVARQAAVELTAHDALAAHADIELGIDPTALSSPIQAALASAVAFTLGALIPVLSILTAPSGAAVVVTVVAVVFALVGTGLTSARLGQAPPLRATLRNVLGGLLAMGITFAIGRLVGSAL